MIELFVLGTCICLLYGSTCVLVIKEQQKDNIYLEKK